MSFKSISSLVLFLNGHFAVGKLNVRKLYRLVIEAVLYHSQLVGNLHYLETNLLPLRVEV